MFWFVLFIVCFINSNVTPKTVVENKDFVTHFSYIKLSPQQGTMVTQWVFNIYL